jgi:hypothetical protein
MRYCIDASALIDLGERHYPERLSIFAPIWSGLYARIDDGTIVSVDYVRVELERVAADWRSAFLVRAAGIFLVSEEVEMEYAQVAGSIERDGNFRANKARDRFMSGADPWVIARARNLGQCTVVSAEKKDLASYGLGAVCNTLGVPHMNLIEFFEATGIGK